MNITIKTLDENSAVPGENAEAVRNDTVSKAEDIAEVRVLWKLSQFDNASGYCGNCHSLTMLLVEAKAYL